MPRSPKIATGDSPSVSLPVGLPIGLAMEVIGREGSVALMRGDTVTRSQRLPNERRAASTLIPAIEAILTEKGEKAASFQPDFIGVAIGPGSFTGLRIAVTAAKTLAYAWGIPLVEVDSLTAIQRGLLASFSDEDAAKREQTGILVGLSAYRGQVFRGRFAPRCQAKPEIELIPGSQWKEELTEIAVEMKNAGQSSHCWISTGDRTAFERSGVSLESVGWTEESQPRAAGVGMVAAEKYRLGQTKSPLDIVPDYFRPSSAEEKLS